MTSNEKSYMQYFWSVYQTSDQNKSIGFVDESDDCREYREKLSISWKRGYDLRKHIITNNGSIDDAPIPIHGIILHFHHIIINLDSKSSKPTPYDDLIDQMLQFEAVVGEILMSAATLSKQCDELFKPFANVAGYLINNKNKYDHAVGAGLAIAAFGALISGYKKYQVEQQKEYELRELSVKRRELAITKRGSVISVLSKIDSSNTRFKTAYYEAFKQSTTLNESHLNDKLYDFKLVFLLYVKRIFLSAILHYIINVFDSWEKNLDISLQPPVFNFIVNSEIQKWPEMMGYQLDNFIWDEVVKNFFAEEDSSITYPLPFLLFFNDPYLLKMYIGIELFEIQTTNEGDGLITILRDDVQNRLDPSNKVEVQYIQPKVLNIIQNNPYFVDCKTISDRQTAYPIESSISDYLFIFALAIPTVIISALIWHYFNGWLFAISSFIFSFYIFHYLYKHLLFNFDFVKVYYKYLHQNSKASESFLTISNKFNEFNLNTEV